MLFGLLFVALFGMGAFVLDSSRTVLEGITPIGARLWRRAEGIHGPLDVVVVEAAAGEGGGDATPELRIERGAGLRLLLVLGGFRSGGRLRSPAFRPI